MRLSTGFLRQLERLGDDGAIQEEMLAEAYTEKALADPENSVHWYQLAENHFQHVIDLDRGNIPDCFKSGLW